MKKFLRNMNRGIALLIVLVIGFVGYVVYDNVSFKKEKKPIEDFLKNYYSELAQISLLPEEYRTAGAKPPKEVIDKKRAENKAFLDKYYTTKQVNTGWRDKDDILRNMEDMYAKMQSGKSCVTELEFGFKSAESIRKIAPNTVVASVNYFGTIRAVGDVIVFTGGDFFHSEYELYNDSSALTDGKLREYKISYGMELTLYKTSEGWKIAKSGSSWWSNVTPTVVDDTASKGGTTDGE